MGVTRPAAARCGLSTPQPTRARAVRPRSTGTSPERRKGRKGLWHGAAGPGPPGAAGVSGWEIVRVQEGRSAEHTDLIWTVNCSAGKKVLGGGVTKQIIGNSEVIESGPRTTVSGGYPESTTWPTFRSR